MNPKEVRRVPLNINYMHIHVPRSRTTYFRRHGGLMHRELSISEKAAVATAVAAIGLLTIAFVTLYSPSSEPPQSAPASFAPIAEAAGVEQDPNVEVVIRHTMIFEGKLTLYPRIRHRSTTVADANSAASNLITISPVYADNEIIVENPEIQFGGSATPGVETEPWAVHIPITNIGDEKVESNVNLGIQTEGYFKLSPTNKERRGYQPAVLVQRGRDKYFKTEDGRIIQFTTKILGKREPRVSILPNTPSVPEIIK